MTSTRNTSASIVGSGTEKYSLVGNSLKKQVERLNQLISLGGSEKDIEIETDQESLIAIFPTKAMKVNRKCAITKSGQYWILKLLQTEEKAHE